MNIKTIVIQIAIFTTIVGIPEFLYADYYYTSLLETSISQGTARFQPKVKMGVKYSVAQPEPVYENSRQDPDWNGVVASEPYQVSNSVSRYTIEFANFPDEVDVEVEWLMGYVTSSHHGQGKSTNGVSFSDMLYFGTRGDHQMAGVFTPSDWKIYNRNNVSFQYLPTLKRNDGIFNAYHPHVKRIWRKRVNGAPQQQFLRYQIGGNDEYEYPFSDSFPDDGLTHVSFVLDYVKVTVRNDDGVMVYRNHARYQ